MFCTMLKIFAYVPGYSTRGLLASGEQGVLRRNGDWGIEVIDGAVGSISTEIICEACPAPLKYALNSKLASSRIISKVNWNSR